MSRLFGRWPGGGGSGGADEEFEGQERGEGDEDDPQHDQAGGVALEQQQRRNPDNRAPQRNPKLVGPPFHLVRRPVATGPPDEVQSLPEPAAYRRRGRGPSGQVRTERDHQAEDRDRTQTGPERHQDGVDDRGRGVGRQDVRVAARSTNRGRNLGPGTRRTGRARPRSGSRAPPTRDRDSAESVGFGRRRCRVLRGRPCETVCARPAWERRRIGGAVPPGVAANPVRRLPRPHLVGLGAGYLLCEQHRGAPTAVDDVPKAEWTPAEVSSARLTTPPTTSERVRGVGRELVVRPALGRSRSHRSTTTAGRLGNCRKARTRRRHVLICT